MYSVKFQVLSDRKALASVLRPSRGNKTFSSQLTRWNDRSLLFEFEVTHPPGHVLGFADYLSRHASEIKGAIILAEELWNDWFTVNVISNFNAISGDKAKPSVTQNENILTRSKDSVLKVETEKGSKEPSGDEKHDTRQPIKSQYG